MKIFLKLLVLTLINLNLALASVDLDCVDLSHRTKFGDADTEVRQIGCEKLSRQAFVNGEVLGETTVVELTGQWQKDSIDDEHEAYSRQTRWSWNFDKTILLYEYYVDTLDKSSGNLTLQAGTHIYKESAEDKIEVTKYLQLRVLKADGKITVEQNQNSELLDRLQ